MEIKEYLEKAERGYDVVAMHTPLWKHGKDEGFEYYVAETGNDRLCVFRDYKMPDIWRAMINDSHVDDSDECKKKLEYYKEARRVLAENGASIITEKFPDLKGNFKSSEAKDLARKTELLYMLGYGRKESSHEEKED